MSTDAQSPYLYNLTVTLGEDIVKLHSMSEQVTMGQLDKEKFKTFCVPMGIYEQRQSDTYMLRVRLPAGALFPHQMRVLAQVSRKYGNGVLHLTTRQDIQIHSVPLSMITDSLVALQIAGMSTKGSGGNTVRNITSCQHCGVCKNEVFDVGPYTIALTEFLQGDSSSYNLPRKFKIAMSGCRRDCAGAIVHDLGFIASMREGVAGFAVYVAGGMGAHSAVGLLLEEFIPTDDVYYVTEAIKRVFNQHGNRENRSHARLRFLVQDIGIDAFKELYAHELTKLYQAPLVLPELRPFHQPNLPDYSDIITDDFFINTQYLAWRVIDITPQVQSGYNQVLIPLVLGDITADALEALADVVAQYGEGLLRINQAQNAFLRWVSDKSVPVVYQHLVKLKLTTETALLLQNIVPCTGAGTCRLGICLSRGLAKAIAQQLQNNFTDLHSFNDLQLSISGCSNSCGRHLIADIGFSGVVRQVEGRLVPHYTVYLGGSTGIGQTQLANKIGILPARNIPNFIVDFLRHYSISSQLPDFAAFIIEEKEIIEELVNHYQIIPHFIDDPSYYQDWEDKEPN